MLRELFKKSKRYEVIVSNPSESYTVWTNSIRRVWAVCDANYNTFTWDHKLGKRIYV